MTARAAALVPALAAALALAACGDDANDATTGGTAATPAGPTTTAPDEQTDRGDGDRTGERGRPPGSREDEVRGGPGDEIPASGPADFTGQDGRVGPRVVKVPPFLGILITLRSADGRGYGLRIAGKTLRAGGARRTASVRVGGLRPGQAYEGAVSGGDDGRVRIEASAEPGP